MERFLWTRPLISEQILRQTQKGLCVFPHHTPYITCMLIQGLAILSSWWTISAANCEVFIVMRKVLAKYSLIYFTYEKYLSCWSQESAALIVFTSITLLLPHFDYFWSLDCYCSLFITLLFVIHFLVYSFYLSFFFAIDLFIFILFQQYFSFCYYFSLLVAVKFYPCILCSLFLLVFFFIILCVCIT